MKPLFPFYGSKWREARYHPPPADLVIEPFAGSAGYSTYHEPSRVQLYDVDPYIVGVWNYLIHVSSAEILSLPDLEPGQSTDDLELPQEARWLIGYWLNRGSAVPKKTQTAFSRRTERQQLIWSPAARIRIAAQLDLIRYWTITQASYDQIPDQLATWFVDPPYVDKGKYYRFRAVNYAQLAAWIATRTGSVTVCEQAGATWLPFVPFKVTKSTKGTSAEVVFRC